ncbi:MAG: hypothetical protein IT165_15870 [Bryobacterales bacterium]|nr:hypothetical protein [Bryobacterales bacterium]
MNFSAKLDRLTQVAMAGASFTLAHQVAAKAARDGLFLSRFPATDLPKIVGLAAVVSIVSSLLFSRLLSRFAPARLVPAAYLCSAAGHLIEYFLIDFHRDLIVCIVYLHIVGLGAILLSGFWSLTSEVFDPREAKLRFGRIAGMGTAGGIAGGILAERTAALSSAEMLLPVLAALHLTCGLILLVLGASSREEHHRKPRAGDEGWETARKAFSGSPFLLSLAFLVVLGTTSAALLDYLFKTGATEAMGRGPSLTRYFAIFYTVSQVMTFLVQSLLTPIALRRLGLGRTVMSLALAVSAGSFAALAVPLFTMVSSVRALELILRGSFFRSGYEIFFTPIAPNEKRAVKTVIDVGCDRFGDALGALILQLLLLYPPHMRTEILVIVIGLAAASVWITSRMDRAYIGALERGLMNRAIELDISGLQDSTTISAVLRTVNIRKAPSPTAAPPKPEPAPLPAPAAPPDPLLETLRMLRSGKATVVRSQLRRLQPLDPLLVPQVVRLLAWDEVSEEAREVLTAAGNSITGLLSDVLIDEKQDFAIRRRIPRILARSGSQRAVDGLMDALEDKHFEVRFQSSRALDYLRQNNEDLRFDEHRIFAIVIRELSVAKPIWEGRRLLDSRDASDSGFSFLDDVLRDRANQSLEHVFSLLAVVLPRDPLKIAFRALHSEDHLLRGLGLEYLEGTLPPALNELLTQMLDLSPPAAASEDREEVLARLMRSNQSLLLEFRKISGGAPGPAGRQSTAKES